MRKVTKRLLTVCIAALAVGACQDNVILQDPPDPPPPPPPPGVDATVSILGLDMIPGPGSVNPTAVAGDINVSLNVEEGDNTVTAVDLLFDGAPIGCATINTNTVPGQGISLSTAGGADVIECFWNTDDFAGTCDGSNLPPAFANGTHTLGAQITLDDGTTRTASNTQAVTLVNSDLLTLVMLPGAQSLVSGGVTYYGGPTDTDGDGTDDNSVDYAVCPVSFNGTTVASLSLVPSSASGNDADIGSGSGAADLDSAAPFVWNVAPADNDRASGNPVEDLPGLGNGHDFDTTGQILDDSGLDVSGQFAGASLTDMHHDFTSPLVMAGAEVTIGGASTTISHYSADAGNTFGLTGVTDAGVGFTFGSGAGSTIAVGDCGAAANNDGAFSTAFVPVVGFENVAAVGDVTEDDAVVDADTNAEDCYLPEVTALQDDLFNATDLSMLPTGAPADATINSITNWGADFTGAPISALLPDTDPADAPVFVLNDVTFMFDADDPDLASGDAGSGIDVSGCDGDSGTGFGGGGECTNVTASDGTDTWEVDHDGAGTLTSQVFSVDIADLSGNSSSTAGAMVDGAQTITVTVSDNAVPTNATTDDYTIILDTTAPVIGALNPAPVGSAGTDATSIIMSIGETIDDANIISLADLTVAVNGTDATGAGASASCAAAVAATNLYILDVSTGEIDRNLVDLSNGTNAVDFSGAAAEAFAITDPFPGSTGTSDTVNYCFLIDAEDEALDKSGAANPNVSALVTQVDVTWTSP